MKAPTIVELKKFKHEKGDTRNYWFDGISNYVVKAIYNTSITPIQVNICVTLSGIIMGMFFLMGSLLGKLLGLITFFIYIVLDATDGQLARAKNDVSLKGEYLDKMGHYIVYPIVSFSLGYSNFKMTGASIMLWAGFIMSVAMTLSSASKDCFISVYKVSDSQVKKLRKNITFVFKNILLKIIRFETFIYLIIITSFIDYFYGVTINLYLQIFNLESVVILSYSILLISLNLYKTYLFYKKERIIRTY
jgi:phosphatidylglycerophosphate synthase